jgi:hypothetical protein
MTNPTPSLPPTATRPGDLLSIRPLRLNGDEYLILQKCTTSDCAEADVVRAWNARGLMSNVRRKVTIRAGARYMLAMQRNPTKGNQFFTLFADKSTPLEFLLLGPLRLRMSPICRRHERRVLRQSRSQRLTPNFLATFEGGSVVRIQLLRPKNNAATVAKRARADRKEGCDHSKQKPIACRSSLRVLSLRLHNSPNPPKQHPKPAAAASSRELKY